jgi:arylsulfatase A-like enzyme
VNRLIRCAASATVAPLLLGAVVPGLAVAQDPVDPPRPNIVVVMIDDANPHDGQLWSADVMPELDDLVISRGIRFTDFHGEVPLCGPSRANMLTGQHAHNSGANSNNGTQLDVSTTIATELDGAGYHTAYVGKYLNGYKKFSPEQYDPPGWDAFDVINSNQGKYFWYQIRDRDGNISQHKTAEDDYSTDVIADIAVKRIKDAPDDVPLFALIAPFTPHEPNLPAPRHEGDERCRDLEPWAPPNYDEEDVSDKPAYIQKEKPLGDDGFDLTAHCESLLAVDEMIGRVGKALKQEGRLDDTVFVFIADNGMTWGEHRRVAKVSPYATPMPAYVAWPAGRGVEPRDDATTLSMIDFAPTFCELGGCEMGPYPNGQEAADGLSFAAVLADEELPTVREALLHTVPSGGNRPVWWSIRTTDDHPDGRWHYIENRGGFRELYDISGGLCYEWAEGDPGDPCEMENLLAAEPTAEAEALAASLSAELAELKEEVAPAFPMRAET